MISLLLLGGQLYVSKKTKKMLIYSLAVLGYAGSASALGGSSVVLMKWLVANLKNK